MDALFSAPNDERQGSQIMLDKLFGMATAVAEATGAAGAAGAQEMSTGAMLLQMLLPMALILVVFYFFLIRPQRKKDKKVKDMLAALKAGDRICTIGGIYGTITSIKDDTITLAVGAQRTEMVMARWAIRNVEEVTVENDGEILA